VNRDEKVQAVQDLNGIFTSAGVVVVTHYSGLTVADVTQLRVQMAEAGANFRVIKNRLAKIALDGTPCAGISELLAGPIAIAFSEDFVAAPKVVATFAKQNDNLVILGGVMGETILNVDDVEALAALPSLDELRAKLLSLFNAPATRIAGVLQAPAVQLARVFSAYGATDEAA